MRSSRGVYYATAIEHRDGGKRYGRQVARQAPTFAKARAAVDATGLTGYVQQWSDRTQRRTVVATKDATGWYAIDPFTGQRVDLEG